MLHLRSVGLVVVVLNSRQVHIPHLPVETSDTPITKYETKIIGSALLSEKKCNLTLAMSPTCHSNNALRIC